jgi:hypothetical protein
MPYSRLFPAFGSPARTLKSFLVKLSAVKASTGAAVRSSFHRDNRATRRESQLVRSLKSVPITIRIALADISEIGWLRGSFRASAILICFICISSFTANAHAVTISKAIPSINSHQPRFALRFCRQKSRISANASFSARFSIQSPQNTRTPPTQAVNAVQNIEAADNEPSDAKIIIIYGNVAIQMTQPAAIYSMLTNLDLELPPLLIRLSWLVRRLFATSISVLKAPRSSLPNAASKLGAPAGIQRTTIPVEVYLWHPTNPNIVE